MNQRDKEDYATLLNNCRELTFPCFVVAHGPARHFPTERHGAFNTGHANGPDQVVQIVKNALYEGRPTSMDVLAIYTDTDDGLTVVTLL